MTSVNGTRFIESFVAAVMGAAVYDSLKAKNADSSDQLDALQKFHRALLLAEQAPIFSPETSLRYLNRIAAMSESRKWLYIKSCLQPSLTSFDERISALLIVSHATKTEEEWKSFLSVASLEGRDAQEEIASLLHAAKGELGQWNAARKAAYQERVRKRNPVERFLRKII